MQRKRAIPFRAPITKRVIMTAAYGQPRPHAELNVTRRTAVLLTGGSGGYGTSLVSLPIQVFQHPFAIAKARSPEPLRVSPAPSPAAASADRAAEHWRRPTSRVAGHRGLQEICHPRRRPLLPAPA